MYVYQVTSVSKLAICGCVLWCDKAYVMYICTCIKCKYVQIVELKHLFMQVIDDTNIGESKIYR